VTIAALVLAARSDILDDEAAPYLWSDAQLTRYANEACLEACKRAPLIQRTNNVAVTAATAAYAIDAFTRQIYVAKLNLETVPLTQTTDAQLSYVYGSSWRTITGTPRHYVRRGHTITLFPVPIVNDTLVITGSSVPDGDFDVDVDIDSAYHDSLLHWIAYKAYLKTDADTYNPLKAVDFLKMFDAKFGPAHTARYDQIAQDTPKYSTLVSGRMC